MRKIIILIIVELIILSSSISFAENESDGINSLGQAIKSNRQVKHLFAGEEKVLMDISRSIFDVLRYIILAGAVIRLFGLYLEYANIGDNPQVMANIKTKSLWYVLGIIFVLNFWTIIRFLNQILTKIRI